jgi:hypothetical protein
MGKQVVTPDVTQAGQAGECCGLAYDAGLLQSKMFDLMFAQYPTLA